MGCKTGCSAVCAVPPGVLQAGCGCGSVVGYNTPCERAV